MKMMTRRHFSLGSLAAGLAAALSSPPSRGASASPAVDPNDPAAKALGFVTDAKKVDAAANPTFKAAQTCASCAQYQGKATDASAPCNIFGGKAVPAGGWCKVWAPRAG